MSSKDVAVLTVGVLYIIGVLAVILVGRYRNQRVKGHQRLDLDDILEFAICSWVGLIVFVFMYMLKCRMDNLKEKLDNWFRGE